MNDEIALAVPTSVKARRKKLKWTQEKLASEAGLSTTAIHNLEKGKNGFTDKTLAALAAALNCRPADLLLDADEPAATKATSEAEVKALLRQVDLPEAAIGPIWRVIRGYLEDAGRLGPDLPRDQLEPAIPRRAKAPS